MKSFANDLIAYRSSISHLRRWDSCLGCARWSGRLRKISSVAR